MIVRSSSLRGLLSLALAAALLASGPLAVPLQAFLSDEAPRMCLRHGRACTCPDHCSRSGHGHPSEEAANESPQGAACHRTPSSEDSEPASKSACEMTGCGRDEIGAVAALDAPYLPPISESPLTAPTDVFMVRSVESEAPAPIEGSPPSPPPRG